MSVIECIARAIIEDSGKILLCRGKGRGNWYFPGGHIEEGESAPVALLRELDEELGVGGEIRGFAGVSENKFSAKGEVIQEINIIFNVALNVRGVGESKEDHLEFDWFTYDEIRDLVVFPTSLKEVVLEYHESHEPFWVSEGFSP